MDQLSKARSSTDATAAERPIHLACLVTGCPCKADRNVPTRRTAIAAAMARTNGKTAGYGRLPEPTWRFVGLPIA